MSACVIAISDLDPEAHLVARPRGHHALGQRLLRLGLGRDLGFPVGPVLLLEAINAHARRRRTCVHPTIERLVALAHLLPLQPLVALDELGDELLGSDLLEVLLAVPGEVAIAWRKRDALLHFFVR